METHLTQGTLSRMVRNVKLPISPTAAHAPDKPCRAKRGGTWVTPVRVGTITRCAIRPEEQRLFQQASRMQLGEVKDILAGTASIVYL